MASFINGWAVWWIMDEQVEVQKLNRLRRFIKECLRVMHVTRKPTLDEFKTLLKVTGMGVLILGAMGFIVFLIKETLFN